MGMVSGGEFVQNMRTRVADAWSVRGRSRRRTVIRAGIPDDGEVTDSGLGKMTPRWSTAALGDSGSARGYDDHVASRV